VRKITPHLSTYGLIAKVVDNEKWQKYYFRYVHTVGERQFWAEVFESDVLIVSESNGQTTCRYPGLPLTISAVYVPVISFWDEFFKAELMVLRWLKRTFKLCKDTKKWIHYPRYFKEV